MSKQHKATFPNALIVGVQKSATTWLQTRLEQHPEVHIPRQELHFFDVDKNYERGPSWYSSQFDGSENFPIRCEKTPDYIWTTCEDVPHEPKDKPERIHALIPNAKLLVVLRDPVKRAISGWHHNVRSGAIGEGYSIERMFEPSHADLVARHGILSRGLYYAQLARFFEIFPPDQILVMFQESDIGRNPESGLRRVCDFLDINPEFPFTGLHSKENKLPATKPGVALARRTKGDIHRLVRGLDRHLFARLPLPDLEYPKPSSALLEQLNRFYEDDVRLLDAEFGPIPDTWLARAGLKFSE